MTPKQMLAKAKSLRADAARLESFAKRQEKLSKQLARLDLSGRTRRTMTPPVKRIAKPAFRAQRGTVGDRIMDLLAGGKAMHVQEMWERLGPEGVTSNALALKAAVYTLHRRGKVESTALGVWRKTVKPTREELHGKDS